MSTIDTTLTSPIRPFFTPSSTTTEPPSTSSQITALHLQKHPEGGYYHETDRDPLRVPNPFRSSSSDEDKDKTRAASTTIYYLLTPASPTGRFHRNKGRTMHTLHRGRGRYVIIHGDEREEGERARVETFVVGHDVHDGERLQWLVEGGKYKASFLLPDKEGESESEGLLISETVVPGFEFSDHNFMPPETLPELLSDQQADELRWLLSSPN
ncbi:hypothetical protein IMSHALPRED_002250 [Imshaugia aleurites]|uniref:DUF985 domain-containing protein n=1 Tax=Imshaugia aleurites TaxID=172621 RepID=A0A8H3J5G4_9LECA|nr:hypothetical protein IMSHALPRED_002250 [Imshaugia aleurites]